jgi:F-type H+-transporting ATPase subunit b
LLDFEGGIIGGEQFTIGGSRMNVSGLCRKNFGFYFLVTFTIIALTAGSAAAESEGGGGITVIPDISLFFQIANFLFLLWALNMILIRPIRKILRERKEKIENFEATIATFDKDIQEKDQAFVNGQKAARLKGIEEKEALLQEAGEEESKILADVNARAQQEFAEVQKQIKNDVEVAKGALQEKIDEFANDISQKILGRAV